ncbi:MAG: AraC family transcriptional regulator [Prevotellaceae bacterium]|jgi:AraC-like DNA-binding protein/mannose-6-phosphate isomerase-like protein (cupin superfamily)|nr:AraC family transcriptional regulator [Prevotellaceae bacterium]
MEQLADGFKGEKAIVTPYSVRTYQAQNEITKQLYVTHIGYYPDAKYHYRVRKTGAPEHILIYCEKGKGWIECRGERVQLTDNSFFIIPANEQHAYGADARAPWSIYWLHFKGEHVDMFHSIIGKLIHVNASDQNRLFERMQLFEEMYRNLEMGYNPENMEYISFCLMHFLASLKYIPQYREIKKIKESDIVERSILFMKENLETKIVLEDIARAVGYSASRFNTLFLQRTSFSPMEYYNQLRIQRACSYLQFSDHKIKEIAFRLGYYDPFHFSKAFHKEMELTPKEYRKRYMDKEIGEIGE